MESEKREMETELIESALTKLKTVAKLANKRHDELDQHDIERIAHYLTNVIYNLQCLRNRLTDKM